MILPKASGALIVVTDNGKRCEAGSVLFDLGEIYSEYNKMYDGW